MITLTVASYNGAALAQPLAAQFDEMGGNIGRADTNQLVLPDPERTISRVHAQVVFRNGRYAIVDRGSNPVSVNGRPLGNGQESPLQVGDKVQIGGYLLKVEQAAAAGARGGAADPFADFGGLAAPSPPPRTHPPQGGGMGGMGGGSVDPLAAFGMAPAAPAPAYGRPGASPPPSAAPAHAGGIPADWDPFAPDPPSAASAGRPADPFGRPAGHSDLGMEVGGRGAGPLIPDMPGSGSSLGGGDSLDNLFGLGAPGSGAADPFANSALQSAAAQPNMAAHADPMRSLNSLTHGSASAAPDRGSELQTPFALPPMVPQRPPGGGSTSPPGAPIGAPQVAPGAASAPKGSVLSWDAPTAAPEGRTIIRQRAAAAAAAAGNTPPQVARPPVMAPQMPPPVAPMMPPAMPAMPAGAPRHGEASPAAPAPTPRHSTAPSADIQALANALRDGLGVPGLPIETLTPEFMKLIGTLLHEAMRGTVDLLVARAALKREVRAEVTMIVTKENNPLKFSPSADVAINHLLNPPARGFMPADRAIRDAYEDLRAHQFAFLAGMRAALEGVLKRFDPSVLEGKLSQKSSVIASLLPGSRKARMWDVFQELYGQISAEASDDFHELFGKEFLRAYESHIDQLSREPR